MASWALWSITSLKYSYKHLREMLICKIRTFLVFTTLLALRSGVLALVLAVVQSVVRAVLAAGTSFAGQNGTYLFHRNINILPDGLQTAKPEYATSCYAHACVPTYI
jgi:glucan phosphoethanolaminetransferase (alkaline phosphatase superfamily)